MKISKTILFAFTAMICFIAGCTYTTSISKPPAFNKDAAEVETELRKIISFESADVNGTESNTNGNKASSLEIKIVNGVNVPANEIQLKRLAKEIGSFVKGSLKDPNQYNQYLIGFVSKKEDGVVSSSNTFTVEFSSVDL